MSKCIKVIQCDDKNHWAYEQIGEVFKVVEEISGTSPHKGSVIVKMLSGQNGWLWPEQFEIINFTRK